jgi:hypothetical protein
MDNETWLIEVGDEVIVKKSQSSYEALSEIDKSIYCFWVIDYAVRNSGTLGPLNELHPSAINELMDKAIKHKWIHLYNLLSASGQEKAFCELYYKQYDLACSEIRFAYENI